jgi:hypothetical protein
MFRKISQLLVVLVLILSLIGFTGCAQTMQAIEHSRMTVNVKMSDAIFLDATLLVKNRTAYIRVTNTSDMQEIVFESMLRDKIAQRGITLVSDPSQAGYIIQANVLYMDYEKKGMAGDGMLAGGFGGALAGASIGDGSVAGALIGGVAGSLIGGAIGAAFKVETYAGVIDVQIQERVEGGVRGTMKTDARQGLSTTLQTERDVRSDFQTYRTRMLASAKQTNIDRAEAARVVSERLAQQIAGMF